MDTHDDPDLLTIGTFARQVGLTPSALRFYDDCGVLRPARVDDGTGYRYYAPAQRPRAARLRQVREAGLPLTDALTVLDGPPEAARAVLAEHVQRARAAADAAGRAVAGLLREIGPAPAARARVGGAELAGALRQVAPAAARGAARREHPALGCVLLELAGDELRLVATDRYRLAVRTLRAGAAEGGPAAVLLDAAAPGGQAAVAAWAPVRTEVTVEIDGPGRVRLRAGEDSLDLPAGEGEFPDHHLMLGALPPPAHRLVTGRAALREAVAAAPDGGPVVLRADGDRLLVAGPEGRDGAALPALRGGTPPRLAFDPAVLVPALDASVGPDVLLDIATADGPVVVRSADQGCFTTLVMPVRDPSGGTAR
jgi:DNA-binding transcriptional MerR regulator